MGDRGQIKIEDTGVYLYSHWGGNGLADLLKRILSLRQRWNDPEYLARMIFSEMVSKDLSGETGYGIGTTLHTDLDNKPILVNCKKQKVGRKSFEDFIKVSK